MQFSRPKPSYLKNVTSVFCRISSIDVNSYANHWVVDVVVTYQMLCYGRKFWQKKQRSKEVARLFYGVRAFLHAHTYCGMFGLHKRCFVGRTLLALFDEVFPAPVEYLHQ